MLIVLPWVQRLHYSWAFIIAYCINGRPMHVFGAFAATEFSCTFLALIFTSSVASWLIYMYIYVQILSHVTLAYTSLQTLIMTSHLRTQPHLPTDYVPPITRLFHELLCDFQNFLCRVRLIKAPRNNQGLNYDISLT